MEIYDLLIAAGGNKCHPVYSDTTGTDQFEFWMNFSSRDYKISAADILRDEIHQTAPMTHARTYNGVTLCPWVDYESFTRLHKSVLGLTTESLRTLLPQLSCLDDVDSFGNTALHLAAYEKNAHAISLLLKWGASTERLDNNGKTPLHISATRDSATCAEALAAGGANLQARDQLGNTPLHHACKLGHLRVVEALLDYGADIKDCNYSGESPLTYANLGGHLSAVKLLHRHDADLTHRDKLGTTVVHDAIWFNSHDALKFYLQRSMRVDQKLQNGKSTLHLLAEEGNMATMQIFLDFAHNGLGRLNVGDADDRSRIAMDYLECRRDAAKVSRLFQLVLQRVRDAGCELDSEEGEDNEVFWDAVES